MKIEGMLIGITFLLVIGIVSYGSITANIVSDLEGTGPGAYGSENSMYGDGNPSNENYGPSNFDEGPQGPSTGSLEGGAQGPSIQEFECMQSCVAIGCEPEDRDCMEANAQACGIKCNVDASGPPEPADEGEACMQECISQGCDEYDFQCRNQNMDSCEEKCNMKGDAPDESEMGEEQRCIHECIMEKDPTARCQNSPKGEIGNRACKRCAKKCVHLYDGPCLNDKQIKQKEKECETCKHCYGEPVEGASGQGWDCIIDIECKDASSEFGDEPGEGPGIGQEGYINRESVAERIGGFFKGLFGGKNSDLQLEKIKE